MTATILFLSVLLSVFIVFSIGFYQQEHPLFYFFIILSFIFMTVLSYIGWQINLSETFAPVLYALYWVMLIITGLVVLFSLLDLTLRIVKFMGTNKPGKIKDNLL
jgi:hypothetical protein